MFIERIVLSGFRCFGPADHVIAFADGVTAFVGANGSGKTAVMHALLRIFGVTGEHRRLRRTDFHVGAAEESANRERHLAIEAVLAFPELDDPVADDSAIPEFFHQMAADEAGRLKCRLRLEATWSDDGSLDGTIEQRLFAIRTFSNFAEGDCIDLRTVDRSRIQMIYVPASRDAASHLTAFLRGRLWRAVAWSQALQDVLESTGAGMNASFAAEQAVAVVSTAVKERWQDLHSAGTDATPIFRPVDVRFTEFIRKVEVVFHPDEAGRERTLDELSDGQRSLFHLALTAAALDVEGRIAADPVLPGFAPDSIPLPALTLIGLEEPENSLAPFYLSRIMGQIEYLTTGKRGQAIVSSHSASILARADPARVRHFRVDTTSRTTRVHPIRLPHPNEDASKFVRQAVRAYPELYFARFVVLCEGASEEVVLPRLAEARGLAIDRSFVSVVPIGGRHVQHLWRLLADLDIPHATLLDLDWGRDGGGWGRIKTACTQLLENGVAPDALFGTELHADGPAANLAAFDQAAEDWVPLNEWVQRLRSFGVFYCVPLDLDYSMLRAFEATYSVIEPGQRGPSSDSDPRAAVHGAYGKGELYGGDHDQPLRWYRYLFLGRGKPSTHARVLSTLDANALAAAAPEELGALLEWVAKQI